MTETEFIEYWYKQYPESFPIGHELKWAYHDRWFRIHSLPESKRYADTEEEYEIIIDRQNRLMDDLIGTDTEVVLLFGIYRDDHTTDFYKEFLDVETFYNAQTIDLQKERPEQYEDEVLLDIFIKIENWENNKRNAVLRSIADDRIRGMFICPLKKCIVSPYDGGVDIIVDSTEKRDELKLKYREWLSDRADGL